MTAIEAVASYLPGVRVPIDEVGKRFDLTPMQIKVFRRYHKLGDVLRYDGSLTELLRGALAGLAELRGQEQRVRYVIYARTFPHVVPYPHNPLHELCAEFGLDHAQAFAVSHQACASGLQAIDLAGRLLAGDAEPGALALVLTGEKAFTGETQLIPETSFFGEGAAACLISADGRRDRMLSYAAWLRGEFDGAIEDVAGDFQEAYPDSLADAISTAADRAGLTVADLSLILPHNVNMIAWQRVCRRIGFPLDRVLLDHVAEYGHLFCADAFVNFQTATQRGLLRPGDRYAVAAAGAGRGATFSAMIFEH